MKWRLSRVIYIVVGAVAGLIGSVLVGLLGFGRGLASSSVMQLAPGTFIGMALGALWPDRAQIPIFRWLVGVPAAFLGWIAGSCVGFLIAVIGDLLCPDKYAGWRGCTSPHFQIWEGAAIIGGIGIASFLFVLLPALAVQSRRRTVAAMALVFQFGAMMVLLSIGAPVGWELLALVLLPAVVALWFVHRLIRSAPVSSVRHSS